MPRRLIAVALAVAVLGFGAWALWVRETGTSLPAAPRPTFVSLMHDRVGARGPVTVEFVSTTLGQAVSVTGVGGPVGGPADANALVYVLLAKGSFTLPNLGPPGPPGVAPAEPRPGNIMFLIDGNGVYITAAGAVGTDSDVPDFAKLGTVHTAVVDVGS